MPRHRHKVDSFSVTTAPHTHPIGPFNRRDNVGTNFSGEYGNWRTNVAGSHWITQSAGGSNTGSASPYTNYIGSGEAFNNLPPYLVINIWKRLT